MIPVDRLVQDCVESSALAVELSAFLAKSLICPCMETDIR